MNFDLVKIIDVKSNIGVWVQQLRKNEKLTQEELATLLGVTRGTIKNLEHGKNATLDTLLKVLQHFDLLPVLNEFINNQKSNNENIDSLY